MPPAAAADTDKATEKELQRLRRLPENRVCPNCRAESQLGFGAVCMAFKTFVCDQCKSAHQSFSHRTKSVNMSVWQMSEVKALDEHNGGGNREAQRRYLARLPDSERPTKDSSLEAIKRFVERAYIEQRWVCPEGELASAGGAGTSPQPEHSNSQQVVAGTTDPLSPPVDGTSRSERRRSKRHEQGKRHSRRQRHQEQEQEGMLQPTNAWEAQSEASWPQINESFGFGRSISSTCSSAWGSTPASQPLEALSWDHVALPSPHMHSPMASTAASPVSSPLAGVAELRPAGLSLNPWSKLQGGAGKPSGTIASPAPPAPAAPAGRVAERLAPLLATNPWAPPIDPTNPWADAVLQPRSGTAGNAWRPGGMMDQALKGCHYAAAATASQAGQCAGPAENTPPRGWQGMAHAVY